MAADNLDPARFGASFKAFMDAMLAEAKPRPSPLLQRIQAHLDTDLFQLPVLKEEYELFEQPNMQRAVDEYIAMPGRSVTLVGVGAENKRFMAFGLSDLLNRRDSPHGHPLDEGPLDYVNFHLANGEVLPCVDLGLLFIHDGTTPLLALINGGNERGPVQRLTIEVTSPRRETAQAFIAEVTALMDRLNVYRGHVISLSPGESRPGRQTAIAFHHLPHVTHEDIILPSGLLERVERHTVLFGEHSRRLAAAGRSLKRGLLLYGPPGVGKTLTVQYLASRMRGRTVILTAGLAMGLLQPAVQLARKLAPAMIVLEDVDLIAEQRGMPHGHSGPLLFTLLNEMDGLQDDRDVIFLLTTNRAEILEPALAARPGRIDLAVEFPLPDAGARVRLLELYARGLELQDVDFAAVAERIDGATPAYIKELLRKSAVLAMTAGDSTVVTNAHLEAALAELDAGGDLAHRLLGLRRTQGQEESDRLPDSRRHVPPSGFPAARTSTDRM